jgi:hypothetical protein
MADDKLQNGDENTEDGGGGFDSDSGLGNLPPLSDFQSSMSDQTDSNLPPLDDFDSGGAEKGQSSSGGLPPISDIPVETPVPTGGNIQPTPSGFETPSSFDTPVSDSGLDTPQPEKATSFQDLAADSDFTPETPEIGPGPGSDLETPMFDSAFGTPETPVVGMPDTSAPTQAMETPMFETGPESPVGGDAVGFDDGAFGPAVQEGGFDAGTPVPDFSPDTAPPVGGPTPPPAPMPEMAAPPAPPKKQKGGMSKLLVAILVVIFAIGGFAGGLFLWPMISPSLSFLTNPLQVEYDQMKGKIPGLEQKAKDLKIAQDAMVDDEGNPIKPAEFKKHIEDLGKRKNELTASVADLEPKAKALEASMAKLTAQSQDLDKKIKDKNQQFADSSESYEELLNQIAVVRARDNGLRAEVQRLEELVGMLEDANARRVSTKDTLAHAGRRLEALIKEGSTLAPSKYARDKRLAAVTSLKSRVSSANWVSPDLLEDFTSLFLKELEMAGSTEYFFARIPTTDRFGITYMKWAECRMNGNWSVYYRTIDGANIGAYENVAIEGPARYEFREELPEAAKVGIEATIIASRSEGFEDRIGVLAQKQEILESTSKVQRIFDSLK